MSPLSGKGPGRTPGRQGAGASGATRSAERLLIARALRILVRDFARRRHASSFLRACHAAARVAPEGVPGQAHIHEPRGSAPRERDHRGGDRPGPIPNPAVKPAFAESTAAPGCGRAGRRARGGRFSSCARAAAEAGRARGGIRSPRGPFLGFRACARGLFCVPGSPSLARGPLPRSGLYCYFTICRMILLGWPSDFRLFRHCFVK